MIYQLKVTLQDISPPVWRRLLVHADITFAQLHEILQIAFQWEDIHLHQFVVRKIPQDKAVKHRRMMVPVYGKPEIFIGIPDRDGWGPPCLHERREKLSEWLRHEKDHLVYIYDFGDDWRHRVELEKILEESPDMDSPICIKLKGASPDEDSKFEIMDEGWRASDKAEEARLMEELNQQLQAARSRLVPKRASGSRVPSSAASRRSRTVQEPASAGWRELFQLAKDYRLLAPWNWMSQADIFAVHDAASGQTGYCSVIGSSGRLYGLVVYRGDRGLRSLLNLLHEEGSLFGSEAAMYMQDAILLSYEDRADLDGAEYRLVASSGVGFRGHKAWPVFHDRAPHYVAALLDERDVPMMIRILQQAIHVCQEVALGQRELPALETGRIFARISELHQGQILWRDGDLPVDPGEEEVDQRLAVSELEMAAARKRIPRVPGMKWEFDVFHLPVPVDDPKRPYYPIVGLCMDIDHGVMLPPLMAHPSSIQEELQRSLLACFTSVQAMPEVIYIQRPSLMHLLRPVCDKLGIRTGVVKQLPLLNEAKQGMIQHMMALHGRFR